MGVQFFLTGSVYMINARDCLDLLLGACVCVCVCVRMRVRASAMFVNAIQQC